MRSFFYSFVLFFLLLLPPLGGRARARSALSRVCFRERFFVFLRLAMGSRSRAPVLWDRATRMTRETNGCIRSLRADANGSFRVQMSRRISFLEVFFERVTFLTFASSWRSARREFTKRAVLGDRKTILLVEDLFHLEMKFETSLSLSLSFSNKTHTKTTKHNRSRALLPRDQEQTVPEI